MSNTEEKLKKKINELKKRMEAKNEEHRRNIIKELEKLKLIIEDKYKESGYKLEYAIMLMIIKNVIKKMNEKIKRI